MFNWALWMIVTFTGALSRLYGVFFKEKIYSLEFNSRCPIASVCPDVKLNFNEVCQL